VGLGRFEDARDAIIDGLQFEPDEKDLNAYLLEVDELVRKRDAGEPLVDESDDKFSPFGPASGNASGGASPSKSGAATPAEPEVKDAEEKKEKAAEETPATA
jgi:translocation protein SEC72